MWKRMIPYVKVCDICGFSDYEICWSREDEIDYVDEHGTMVFFRSGYSNGWDEDMRRQGDKVIRIHTCPNCIEKKKFKSRTRREILVDGE